MSLAQEIKKFLKGEVYDDAATLRTYSRDASLFEIVPQVVVAPKDVKDLAALVKYAAKKKIALTPRSGGSDMTGAAIGEEVIVDFTKRFNRVKAVNERGAITEPGVFYRDFEAATLRNNLLLPTYPASREICTVGGMVANNAGGEKTPRYGKTENYVTALKVVLADGKEYTIKPLAKPELQKLLKKRTFEAGMYRKIYQLVEKNKERIMNARPKVSKNSAGYALWNVWDGKTFDLTKLFVGSQGTLGLITEISFRLVRPKPHAKMLVVFLRDVEKLGDIAARIAALKPESFESFDDNTLKLVLRYLPDLVKLIRAKNIFSLALKFLPEFWMALTGGIPKLVLLAEFAADTPAEALAQAAAAKKAISRFKLKSHIVKTDAEARKYWVMRRESFNLLRYHLKDKRTAPFIDDIVVRPEKLPQFLPALREILAPYKTLTYTLAGHVGDGNFHIIPLMNMKDPENRRIIPELSRKVYGLTIAFGGSITGEHNDGLIRGPYLAQMFGKDMYKLFETVKKIFDPVGIFNPGRKVGVDEAYALKHLQRS